MTDQKIIILGSNSEWEEEQLLTNYNYIEFISLDNIQVKMGKKTELFVDGKNFLENLSGSEKFIIRRTRGNFEKMVSIVQILIDKGFVLTDSLLSISTNLNKELALPLIESEVLPHPPQTSFVNKNSNIHNLSLTFPIISKPVTGRHGEGVAVHQDLESLEKTIENSEQTLIVQELLEIKSEYRVLVVGDQSLGVIEKKAAPGKIIANYAAGATFQLAELPGELLDEAVRLCSVQGIDIGGVDIALDKSGNYYTLEINRCPEFKAFSAAAKVNVAKKIIDFTLNKSNI